MMSAFEGVGEQIWDVLEDSHSTMVDLNQESYEMDAENAQDVVEYIWNTVRVGNETLASLYEDEYLEAKFEAANFVEGMYYSAYEMYMAPGLNTYDVTQEGWEVYDQDIEEWQEWGNDEETWDYITQVTETCTMYFNGSLVQEECTEVRGEPINYLDYYNYRREMISQKTAPQPIALQTVDPNQ